MTLPLPEGCAECGWPRHGHYQRWTMNAGWHAYAPPNTDLIQARMRARSSAKEGSADAGVGAEDR
ncbi:hypothetical protein [Dactylosporangium salmoneum]|uniref:hypothetical protein n=1 Tax=Dactylosporangium salmoneum TaxID=53361 RepID=UPI0031DBB4B5